MAIEEYRKKSNVGIGIGIAGAIVGAILMQGNTAAISPTIGLIVALAAGIVFIWGCFMYAQSKGYAPALGLLGIFGLIGLLILLVMPDKAKDGTAPSAPPA